MGDVVSLREYIEVRLAAMEQAVTKAEAAADKRFESINEMRAMVTDAALQYLPRKEFEAAIRGLSEKVEFLNKVVMPRGEYDLEHRALVARVDTIDKQYLSRAESDAARAPLVQKNDDEHRRLFTKQESQARLIWIGVGLAMAVAVLAPIVFNLLRH